MPDSGNDKEAIIKWQMRTDVVLNYPKLLAGPSGLAQQRGVVYHEYPEPEEQLIINISVILAFIQLSIFPIFH